MRSFRKIEALNNIFAIYFREENDHNGIFSCQFLSYVVTIFQFIDETLVKTVPFTVCKKYER